MRALRCSPSRPCDVLSLGVASVGRSGAVAGKLAWLTCLLWSKDSSQRRHRGRVNVLVGAWPMHHGMVKSVPGVSPGCWRTPCCSPNCVSPQCLRTRPHVPGGKTPAGGGPPCWALLCYLSEFGTVMMSVGVVSAHHSGQVLAVRVCGMLFSVGPVGKFHTGSLVSLMGNYQTVCSFYLSVFAILEIKTEKYLKHSVIHLKGQ